MKPRRSTGLLSLSKQFKIARRAGWVRKSESTSTHQTSSSGMSSSLSRSPWLRRDKLLQALGKLTMKLYGKWWSLLRTMAGSRWHSTSQSTAVPHLWFPLYLGPILAALLFFIDKTLRQHSFTTPMQCDIHCTILGQNMLLSETMKSFRRLNFFWSGAGTSRCRRVCKQQQHLVPRWASCHSQCWGDVWAREKPCSEGTWGPG